MTARTDTVFVLDDDPPTKGTLRPAPAGAGIEVRPVASVKELVAGLQPGRAACVVLALHRAGVNGLDRQRELAEAGVGLPVIFLTEHGDAATAVRALQAGAADYLLQPADGAALLAAVRRVLDQERIRLARARELERIHRRFESLTRREREVLSLVVSGLPNKAIAADLGAAEKTIKVHRGRIMEKMGAGSLPDLVRMAALIGVSGTT